LIENEIKLVDNIMPYIEMLILMASYAVFKWKHGLWK